MIIIIIYMTSIYKRVLHFVTNLLLPTCQFVNINHARTETWAPDSNHVFLANDSYGLSNLIMYLLLKTNTNILYVAAWLKKGKLLVLR